MSSDTTEEGVGVLGPCRSEEGRNTSGDLMNVEREVVIVSS